MKTEWATDTIHVVRGNGSGLGKAMSCSKNKKKAVAMIFGYKKAGRLHHFYLISNLHAITNPCIKGVVYFSVKF